MTMSCQHAAFLIHPTEPMLDPQTIIRETRTWLSSVIIALKLCPFAKREFDRDSIHYAVIETSDLEAQLEHIIEQCRALDRAPERETSLLIFPHGLSAFETYLDVLDIATALMTDQGYEGTYQLASFHPDYRFDGVTEADPANYTNRSPYPMLHILREASVERALESFPNPENIPSRNIKLTQEMGLQAMRALLAACYEKRRSIN